MISRADNKSMLGYGHEKDLGSGCRLLGGSKQNCGCQCRPLQQKKEVVGADVGCYNGKNCCGHHH
jgi:hypothetical protein